MAAMRPDLLAQSEIMITVNDRNAASLQAAARRPVMCSSAARFRCRSVCCGPASTASRSKRKCRWRRIASAIRSRRSDGKKRFLLLDTSEIILPPIARIARMPNLAVTATGRFPVHRYGGAAETFRAGAGSRHDERCGDARGAPRRFGRARRSISKSP